MEKQSVIHSTFVIERHYPKPPKRVFTAFTDPTIKQRWFVGNNKAEAFEMDVRAGGRERVAFRMDPKSPIGPALLTTDGLYLDVVVDRRIVVASSMAREDQVFSASLLTVELRPAADGTDLTLTFQAAYFEGADGPKMREDGWRKLLENLAAELAHS